MATHNDDGDVAVPFAKDAVTSSPIHAGSGHVMDAEDERALEGTLRPDAGHISGLTLMYTSGGG